MAVDVKTLTIGSHILVNGKRERVRGLDEDNGLIIRFPAEYVNANEVEPIPLTPALLEELGFKTKNQKYNTKCWRRTEIPQEGRRLPSIEFITFWLYRNGYCKIHYRMDFMDINVIVCHYLHEAEAFLALHGVELIKERE